MRHLAKVDVPLFLRGKRANKSDRYERRLERALKKSKRNGHLAAMRAFGTHSAILGLLSTHLPAAVPDKKGRIKFVVPEKFSVLENPVEVLRAIMVLACQLQWPRVREVHIDMSKMRSYDLAANGLLDVLVEEATTKAKRTGHRIRWNGKYPVTPELRRRVQAMGVIKRLKIFHEYPEPAVASRLETFEHRCKNYVRAVRLNDTDEKNRTTQKFVDHVNACLGRIRKELIPEARSVLAKYIGEVIDNAEEHAGMYDWTIQGYLDTNTDDWVCEICIFNFGKTIARTLDDLPPGHYARKYVQPYLDEHEKRGFFSSGWCRERLLTIIALQRGVSSKNLGEGVTTRGYGSFELITFFMKIQRECAAVGNFGGAVMNLISGNTRIVFDGKYALQDGNIAFNSKNDLHSLPDAQCVTELQGISFPGTMLLIKYPLSLKNTAETSGVKA
ncbi:MAG: hypothetical protein COY49_10320 [Comamonadaceae bacterium CG_4_10_14_0_8_um_filter_57_29]|nr:MAG: hypothetical protein COY49_10320 [Comamonadaceae bacterium CG_4_10_14_0_8_um_filter_57_29]